MDHLGDELSGRLAGTESGNETAVLHQVIGDLSGIILNRGIEIAETDDQNKIEDNIEPVGSLEHIVEQAAVGAGERHDGSRQRRDGLGKDDGHNTRHIDLNGQVGVLTAINLAANNALGVLDGNPALGIIDKHDQQHQSDHHNRHDQGNVPVQPDAAFDAGDEAQQGHNAVRQAGDDTGKQDHGDAVADAHLGDPLTQPHDEGSACGEGQDDDGACPPLGVVQDAVAGVGQHDVVSPAHEQAQAHGGQAGDLVQLLLTFLAAFLSQALQRRQGNGQQLDDNGSVDIGLDGQRQNGCGRERGTGHDVVQAQDGVVELSILEVALQSRAVYEGNRNQAAQTVQHQDTQGEQELGPQFGYLPGITECGEHLHHLCLSTCLLDLCLSRLGESSGLHSDLLGQVTVGQHLQTILALAQDALLDQGSSVDNSAVFKHIQASHVDSGQGLGEDIVEATLGDTAGQRHLAAFEADADLAAGAGLLTLVATAAGLTVAGADATTLTLAYLGRTRDRRKLRQFHFGSSLLILLR